MINHLCAIRRSTSRLIALATLVLLCACQTTPTARPVYGADGRTEVIEADAAQCQVGAATMAILPRSSLRTGSNGHWEFTRNQQLQDAGWCSSERFSEQQSQAHCTAFLISKNRVATAGHCINADDDPSGPGLNCNDAIFLFDYKLGIDGQVPTDFKPASVHFCSHIVAGVDSAIGVDWRVISLSRPADQLPLELYTGTPLPKGTQLDIVGHPQGLPMKLMTGASLMEHQTDHSLVADFDTFKGSSGSPIFISGAERPLVVGLFSGGAADHSKTINGQQCKSIVFCNDAEDCDGERATPSAVIAPYAARTQSTVPNSDISPTNTVPCGWCDDPLRSRHWQCEITQGFVE